jgi:glutamate:GABA antiporter
LNVDSQNHPPRVLSVFSLVMINIIAVDSLRTLPISAEYGFSLIFFYIVAAFLFFIPVALCAAELATGWPMTGGLYVWVREAFGKRWGFFAIWLQWVYNVVWYPTILAFMAAAIAFLFNPHLANNKVYLLSSALVLFWLATLVNCFGMRVSSWISTLGAIAGTLLPMLLIIVLGGVWIALGKPEQISMGWGHLFPSVHRMNNLSFFSAILFGLIGMEMSAVHAEEVKNPQRDYPRALLYSTILIMTSLILASLAIALVVPHDKLSLVSGLIDAFALFFTSYHMQWMIPVIVVLIVLGGLSGVSAWIIGPTKGLMAASVDSNLPSLFCATNRYGAPIYILLLQAVIFSVLCSVFVLMPTVNSSYWILSALTAQLALIVYIFMFAALIKLRVSQPTVPRSFKIPGGLPVVFAVAGIGIITCIGAIILGFFPPENIHVGSLVRYESFLILGMLLLSLPPFFMRRGTTC